MPAGILYLKGGFAMAVGPAQLRVELLGPLRLVVGGAPVDVRGPKRRAVLALLALGEGRTVTVDHLVDTLWPADVPDSGRQALHSHVFRLRRDLGAAAARLENHHDGYRLVLDDGDLDVAQARTLLATARGCAPQDPARAAQLLRRALELWRGPELADLTDLSPIATAVEGFAQLRREVTDVLITTALAAGEAETVLGLATTSVAADPLREPAVLSFMRALAATGQAPEALRVASEFRSRLADETGLDPSPALDALVRDVAGGAAGPPPGRPAAPTGPATRLIGREAQVAALHRLIAAERLVTVVGPGGVGKTRVALEIAGRSESATALPLAAVSDPAAIPHALAGALNLRVAQGDVFAACVAFLNERPRLLLVDNCEHLLDTVRDAVADLLSSCPGLSVLATSREPLGLGAEYTYRLAPLSLPGSEADLARVPAVALFLERAARVRPGPPLTREQLRTIADIVHRLDGMPLAIELAARRLSTFTLDDLRDRLDRSLDLLGGLPSGDARHRTLRATIEWSYELLAEEERQLFRHMAVFVDGVDLDTAERLAADLNPGSDPGSVLARLVDASMIQAEFTPGTRYRMLHTLRAFGLDRLAALGEEDVAAARLLRWAVDFTSWIEATVRTEDEPEADAAVRRELPNLRAAWRLARSRGSLDDAVAIITAIFEVITYRDLLEIRGWAEDLADDPALPNHPRAAAVLAAAAEAAYHRGDYQRADRLSRAGLALATDDAGTCVCLTTLSVADLARAAYAEAVEHALAAAALASHPSETLGLAALAAVYSGDLDHARALHERSHALAASPSMRAWAAYVAGEIEGCAGRDEQAEPLYLEAIDLARRSGATFLVGVATVGLVSARARIGRTRDALAGYREVIDYFARSGNWIHQWTTLRNLADLLRRLGDDEPATLLETAADHAPDAPAVANGLPAERASARLSAGKPDAAITDAGLTDRAAVLEVARSAIERNLA